MWTVFTFYKIGKNIFFVFVIIFIIGRIISRLFFENNTPSRIQYLFSGYFKFYFSGFSQHGCCGYFTIRIKNSDEAACDQIVNLAFVFADGCCSYTCWNDSMVVGNLAVVEYFFRLLYFTCQYSFYQGFIPIQSFKCSRYFRKNIVTQKSGIYTRVGGQLLFIKGLNCF